MSSNENERTRPLRKPPLGELREALHKARTAGDAGRVHEALIEVIEGLLGHTDHQIRAIEDLRSDIAHKQGIVTKIGGGDFHKTATAGALREFAASPNGDRWLLGRDERSGTGYIEHRANPPSGGAATRIAIAEFLAGGHDAPEHQALLRLIGGLADGQGIIGQP